MNLQSDLGVAVDANNQQIEETESIPQTETNVTRHSPEHTFPHRTDDQTVQSIPHDDDDLDLDISEYEDGFYSRVRDVFNEKLNHVGPIENFYDAEVLAFEESLARIPATTAFKNHIIISKLFAEDRQFESDPEGPTEELTSSEIAAINLYTREAHMPLYELLNVQLRKVNRRALRPWMPFLRLLVGGLSKLPRERKTLWRATRGVNITNYYNKGRKVFWWGFSSCTTSSEVFDDCFFGKAEEKILFQIESFSAVCIQKYSIQPALEEYILLPGTFLMVTGVGSKDGKAIIYLQEIEAPFPIFS